MFLSDIIVQIHFTGKKCIYVSACLVSGVAWIEQYILLEIRGLIVYGCFDFSAGFFNGDAEKRKSLVVIIDSNLNVYFKSI